jgi:hypothetical protein
MFLPTRAFVVSSRCTRRASGVHLRGWRQGTRRPVVRIVVRAVPTFLGMLVQEPFERIGDLAVGLLGRVLVDQGCSHAVVPGRQPDAVEGAEASDPDAIRWPRSKQADDKTLVRITLT